MALSLRLRRAAALSSSLVRPFSTISSSSSSSAAILSSPKLLGNPSRLRPHSLNQSLSFRSSSILSDRRSDGFEDTKLDPNEILFEGCDYNHWLITMDFPKDVELTAEQKVETYVQTLAKVVGSVEEAKKTMYACSTTTYQGFQAVMSEEMSEKFKGLPGVVFVLPDSYIDPVNKEYGGDKYDNGVITPRPPPIHYQNQRQRGRYDDRNRNYNRQGPQSPMGGDGRNYSQRQNYNPGGQDGSYSPPGANNFGPGVQRDGRNYPPQPNYNSAGQDGRGYGPPVSNNFGPGVQRDGTNYSPQQNYNSAGQDGRGYAPPVGNNFGPPGVQRDYRQGPAPTHGGDFRPGYSGELRQGPGSNYSGDNRHGAGPRDDGNYRQGLGSGPGQNHTGFAEGQTESWQGRNEVQR